MRWRLFALLFLMSLFQPTGSYNVAPPTCALQSEAVLTIGPFHGVFYTYGPSCPAGTIFYWDTFKNAHNQSVMILFDAWTNSNGGTFHHFLVLNQPFAYDHVCSGPITSDYIPLSGSTCWFGKQR